jgi:glycosyltransferase involved in cell wall biosynthesis
MTILTCSNAYPPNFIGGAELIAHQQARRMYERGHRVIVFAGDPQASAERHSIREDRYQDLPVFRVNLHHADYSSEFVNFHHNRIEEHFVGLLNRFSPDVVHMHNIIGLSAGMIHLARRRGIRTVVTLHDHWGFCFKNTLIRREGLICDDFSACHECMPQISDGADRGIPVRMRKDYLALQFSEVDFFISPSMYLAEAYVRAGVPASRIRVIRYGIDTEKLGEVTKEPGKGRVRFTFIGYFGRHKGVQVLLEAARHLDNKAFSIDLIGGGELENELRAQVDRSGLSSIVTFRGKVENERIGEVFHTTDVMVLPAVWPENQPVTITEAMATRTPVIASRIGGIPELVDHGRTGFLFDPGNAQDLANRMREFIDRPALIRDFGENAWPVIRENSLARQVDKILANYNE